MSTSTQDKYAMIREILDKLGFSEWTILRPSLTVSDDVEDLCIVNKPTKPYRRAEFELHTDLFQFGSQSQKLVLAIKKGVAEAKSI
jgi:hypothetical protein